MTSRKKRSRFVQYSLWIDIHHMVPKHISHWRCAHRRPGCPEFAAWIASIESERIVLTAFGSPLKIKVMILASLLFGKGMEHTRLLASELWIILFLIIAYYPYLFGQSILFVKPTEAYRLQDLKRFSEMLLFLFYLAIIIVNKGFQDFLCWSELRTFGKD